MGRVRTLEDLRADVRKEADIEQALSRHPNASIDRYINQGCAALRDLMIEVRGRTYFRSPTPQEITTNATDTKYPLEDDFFQLISIRNAETGDMLRAFNAQLEGELRLAADASGDGPMFYELQPGHIELLPGPSAGHVIVVEYIPTMTDLVNPGDELEGFEGWEDYVVAHACWLVAKRDQDKEAKKDALESLAAIEMRIRKLAPRRDQFRPERVKNVRNRRLGGRFW